MGHFWSEERGETLPDRVSDLRSNGHGFNSRLGHYAVATTWMGDCLRTGEPSWYITTTESGSSFRSV